ncbi:MAG: winged helix-turn-helix domain-containing protein [Spirochaetia bacterium]|nr:winged helix-turn-helix domain-containing protein [Spirochaetia bacterium]
MRVKTQEAILKVLKENNSLTLAEVADRIDKSVSTVERAAKKLGAQGKIKFVGPKKGGYWEVDK